MLPDDEGGGGGGGADAGGGCAAPAEMKEAAAAQMLSSFTSLLESAPPQMLPGDEGGDGGSGGVGDGGDGGTEAMGMRDSEDLVSFNGCADMEPNALALKELLDTSTLDELSITNASSPPQTTSPLKDELILTPELQQALDEAQASAKQFLTQPPMVDPDIFSPNELFLVMATLGKSPITDASTRPEVVTHSPTPPISARKPAGWNHQFFIRVDLGEVFHTYPKLGGPFRSLEEAEKAILQRLDELHDPKMSTNDGLSCSEIAIRDALYWPDGRRKYSSRSNADEDHMGLLVEALLDKYNEENKLSEDCSYQVEKVVSFEEVYEGDAGWYYHLICTIKTKAGTNNQFFAEVSKMIKGEFEEFELTCLHMLESVDNGTCYGCRSKDFDTKHPIDAGKYKGGHDPSWPRPSGSHPLDFACVHEDDPLIYPKDLDAWMKAHEERIRSFFRDDSVANLDARRTRTCSDTACSDKSQERRAKYIVPARRGSAGKTSSSDLID